MKGWTTHQTINMFVLLKSFELLIKYFIIIFTLINTNKQKTIT